jgi:hypothetical protein
MNLTENKYEEKLLLDLPPNARDVALSLFMHIPLNELLLDLQKNKPNEQLLIRHKVSTKYWLAILKAAILAKITYFLPKGNYTKEEILFMLKIVSICIDYPVKNISFPDLTSHVGKEMPTLNTWLTKLSTLLQTLSSK